MSFEIIVVFPDPPSKYVKVAKRKTEIKHNKRTGESKVRLKETTYYLTTNLWYTADLHFSTRVKIVDYAKDYLMLWLSDKKIPVLTNCVVDFQYYRTDEGFDIDNKIGFWSKVFFDLLKTPSTKELKKAKQYNRILKSVNVLKDDNVSHLKGYSAFYKKGEHKMIVRIKGDIVPEQKCLF